MADWNDKARKSQPVRQPARPAEPEPGQHGEQHEPAAGMPLGRAYSRELQRRLAWLLLAAEVGIVLVALCVLPLVFLNVPVVEKGLIDAIVTKVGEWLGLSSQAACLAVALPIPILLVTLGANWWLFQRMRRKAKQTDDQQSV